MVQLSNNTIKQRIRQLSVDILKQTIAAAKLSGNLILELGEITDLGNDAQFMVFMRYRATRDYSNNFSFAVHLPSIPQEKKCLKKVDPFIKEQKLFWTDYVSICADGAPPMRTEMTLWVYEKGKPKCLGSYCLLHGE